MCLIPDNQTESIIKTAIYKYYKENNFIGAINILDEEIIKNKNQNLFYHKAKIYLEESKINESFEIILEGLKHNSKAYLLIQLRIEIVQQESLNMNTDEALKILNEAYKDVKRTFEYFKEDKEENLGNSEGGINYTEYLFKENELKLLESNVKNLIYSNRVLQEVNNTKAIINNEVTSLTKRIENERKSIFELLGLFTALIAFLISGVNIAKDKPTLDGIILITAVGLILMTFLLGIHMVEFIPRRTKDLWWIILIYMFILFCLPFIPKIINFIN
ncbi:MAG: hypothetical protein HY959_06715 [Ignavibacteriae bacterium]|nr:hypothetical protein [Ignavibacteriota bacterium]